MYLMGQEEIEAVGEVIESAQFMRYRGGEGGYTERFERALCAKVGVEHAVTVTSGTAALICALVGLGIGPGDEVIVPAYTWVASALAPLAVGAVPILADVDETLTLDPADLERKITPYTRAVVPVHMCGFPCHMDAIMAIAAKHHLAVCEDACQAVGGAYKGKMLTSIGQAGAYSFNQFKNITCGEGGAVLTSDPLVYERAMIYHDCGCFTRSHADRIQSPFFAGSNFRVSEIQGAILGVQLTRLDGILRRLRERKAAMLDILSGAKALSPNPSNDIEGDCGTTLPLLFDTEAEAKLFAEKHGLGRPIETGRHVYTNWEPLMKQQVVHPKMNPYEWAHREIRYADDMCARTLELLSRTVYVGVPFEEALDDARAAARRLLE
ncbi:MAG: DegT/DnrJ/EryC1/StrS family aminotransferase [Armatimonadetes bacterium]|nr:DegT/DnrJ/EryC1/StrS family aminotransferase [Armatimonadota bacterium]